MKCPSCGIWNRAHFTKCFRCGADLTDAAHADAPNAEAADEQDVIDVPARPAEKIPAANTQVTDPVTPEAENPAQDADVHDLFDEVNEIYSLYDNGDWDDEDDEETEVLYGVSAPALPDDGDDEPVTVYRAPAKHNKPASEQLNIQWTVQAPDQDADVQTMVPAAAISEETAQEDASAAEDAQPVQEVSAPADGATRKFTPVTEPAEVPAAQPAAVDTEPEVAPTDPGISHEIIHAIFTNPPASAAHEPAPDFIDDPRPRKLMSRKRLPQLPMEEDEPETVRKEAPKAEPRVDNVDNFRPTARIAAQKADEQGDEFTAFASAKRNLVAEVEQADPFDAAIELPHASKDVQEPEQQPEEAPKAPETPAWVREAMLNLEHIDADEKREPSLRPETRRTDKNARSRRLPVIEEEEPTRYERASRPSEPVQSAARPVRTEMPVTQHAAPRSGLEAIARHEAGRTASVLQRRNAQPSAQPAPERTRSEYNMEEEIPQSTRRSAARREVPERDQTFRDAPVEEQRIQRPVRRTMRTAPQEMRADTAEDVRPRTAYNPAQEEPAHTSRPLPLGRSLKIENMKRMILVGAAALLLLIGVVLGLVFGIRAIVRAVQSSDAPAAADAQDGDAPTQADPNAPVITTGTVNGRPGHIITFKGNDDDIIYISNENFVNSYNIPIVGGVGTLEIEDSVLIGNRYATDDVEVTLNPVLHEAGSGKETAMDPLTFTVTPPDAYLEILSPEGGAAETTLSTYQVKIRVETGSVVTIDGDDVSDMIAQEDNNLGSIVYNVSVDPIGENAVPVTVMKEGCKSITRSIVLTRPVMSVPIELDAATPSASSSDRVEITGKVEAGVKIAVDSPTDGDVTLNSDGSFKFTAKLSNFGDNDVLITATKGDESSTLTHVVSYTPSYNEYVGKAYRMDYDNLINAAGKSQPYLCVGSVVEVYSQDPYTCLYNVGSSDNPKYIYLQMVEGKPLEQDKEYKVYADVHADGDKDGYPYLIGRYFIEAEQE